MENITIIDENVYLEDVNSNNGINPINRSIVELIKNGFINLDKPAGPTSHEIVSIVKKILNIEKAGHSGTLDPQVTGVLPIGLLNSTKVLSTLLLAPKRYICNMHSEKELDRELISNVFKDYTGEIYQVPPLKSNVVKRLRKRKIYELLFIEQKGKDTLFSVKSEAGTYIRTLCVDIGRTVGIFSFMKELRRIQTGPFYENNVVTLHNLFDAWSQYSETGDETEIRSIIQPVENAIKHLPKIIVRDSAVNSICHGIDLKIPGLLGYTKFFSEQLVSIQTAKNELIGIGISKVNSETITTLSKGIVVHPTKILMNRNFYPSYK